jgi:hypothetical protein
MRPSLFPVCLPFSARGVGEGQPETATERGRQPTVAASDHLSLLSPDKKYKVDHRRHLL